MNTNCYEILKRRQDFNPIATAERFSERCNHITYGKLRERAPAPRVLLNRIDKKGYKAIS